MIKQPTQPIIIQKLYDILVWAYPLISKFPKDKRYTIGNRMETLLIDMLELLVEASYKQKKIDLLQKVNADLEKFRFLTRLAKDLRFMDLHRYEYLSKLVNEVGMMLGGWIKQQAKA